VGSPKTEFAEWVDPVRNAAENADAKKPAAEPVDVDVQQGAEQQGDEQQGNKQDDEGKGI